MKDMDKISIKLADRIHSLMMERAELKAKLEGCETSLCGALVDWAKEATHVHEGCDFLFKGKRAVLFGYNVCVPEDDDFASAERSIGALVRTDPSSFDGPRIFEHHEISAKDFEPLEEDDYEKA